MRNLIIIRGYTSEVRSVWNPLLWALTVSNSVTRLKTDIMYNTSVHKRMESYILKVITVYLYIFIIK